MNFLERTLDGFLGAVEHAMEAEDLAKASGLMQRLDPRVKVVGMLLLIVAVATSHRIVVIAAVFGDALILALSSRVSPGCSRNASGFPCCSLPELSPCPRHWSFPAESLRVCR